VVLRMQLLRDCQFYQLGQYLVYLRIRLALSSNLRPYYEVSLNQSVDYT